MNIGTQPVPRRFQKFDSKFKFLEVFMFNPKSDYALNKLDQDAIVCPSVTGVHTRLTREDFDTEE